MVDSIDERLARQLAKKLKLENRFKPELIRFFKQVGRDATAKWAATGRIPNLNSFQLELIALLRGHYRRVAKAFSKDARNEAKTVNFFLETKQEESIDSDIVDYINQHSIQQSMFILQTTESNLNVVVASVLAAARTGIERPTRTEIAREIRREFDARSINRVDTIAMTETQTPAEEIKFIEATNLNRIINEPEDFPIGILAPIAPIAAVLLMKKTWRTFLDDRTRSSHVAADRQEVDVLQPFIVQGQRLPVPGSSALGATVDNVINCRCNALYTIAGVPVSQSPLIAPQRGRRPPTTATQPE